MSDVPQRLDISRATPDDWSVVCDWAAREGWNPGRADTAGFFAQDPDGFFLGRIDGEPVSAVSVVNYGADYAFLGFYLVRPDLRGRGLGIATWRTGLAHAGERTVGLDGVVAQQDNYRKSGFRPAHRTARYTGTATGADPRPDATVVPVGGDLAPVLAYDRACCPADRPRFLETWLTTDGHTAVARITGGRLTGYAVLRPGHDMPRIGPLFADTAGDARALFDALAPADGPVCIDVPLTNPEAVALVEARGLTPGFDTARMYTGPVREYATERVFGVTTLELG
ncbi:GNAT family N-acetyltransferase [Streptomyces sp. VRA16 Mangrove soil]|uniref:GNAT family N-acetyltransferase n=1 Tax=Streptomyces sp. VRA16 Mangrove soil TaxID=2817434 RepID=UPI001A9EDEA0|nr:GNAT family N-acetyltransferase [Streptomyces sp. VRA16 Mangrove soil]MBO1332158.1 GNAT family N-acetyltransferase [Streptomyces sp. VRA16 Mangrove soil]